MAKGEKVTISGADVGKLSSGELKVLLEKREAAERAAHEALTPLREAHGAAGRAVQAYEKDVADSERQVADAEEWLATVKQHRDETRATLVELTKERDAAVKALADAVAATETSSS